MRRRPTLMPWPQQIARAAAALLCLGLTPAVRAQPESPGAYAITTPAAVAALPDALRPFFESHQQPLRAHAAAVITAPPAPETPRPATETVAGRTPLTQDLRAPGNHYFLLDATSNTAARSAAPRIDTVPRREADVGAWCTQQGHTTCGRLPWALESCYHELVRAFRRRQEPAVVESAACVIHFATDAAMPFNTTVRAWVDATDESADPDPAPGINLRARPITTWRLYQVAVPDRLRNRLAYEVRVFPGRYAASTEPVAAALATMAAAYAAWPTLMADDRVRGSLYAQSERTTHEGLEGYVMRLAGRAAPILEQRLEAGALLAANLIGGAWTAAGRPVLHAVAPTDAQQPAANGGDTPRGEDAPPSGYVASENSAVFHRPDCAHVRRIKPENIIRFSDENAARASGRGPCKACKPAQP